MTARARERLRQARETLFDLCLEAQRSCTFAQPKDLEDAICELRLAQLELQDWQAMLAWFDDSAVGELHSGPHY